jgi:hypothetical protein
MSSIHVLVVLRVYGFDWEADSAIMLQSML